MFYEIAAIAIKSDICQYIIRMAFLKKKDKATGIAIAILVMFYDGNCLKTGSNQASSTHKRLYIQNLD